MTSLTVKTEATVAGLPVCGTAQFIWDSEDPVCIYMTVKVGVIAALEPITWQFARELLDRAFCEPGVNAGRGDVIITVEHAKVRFWLAGDAGTQAIYVPLQPVMDFILESIAQVPIEAETVDVDAALAKLFGDAS